MSTRARHVDSTSPERTRRALAYGHRKDGETTIRTECSICGSVVVHGPKDGQVSHGLCAHPDCVRLQTEPVNTRLLDHLTDRSERLWGRFYHTGDGKDEWKRARRRVMTAHRFACEGPDR